MTLNTQAKWSAFKSLSESGAQEDMEYSFYLANGATGTTVRDAEMQFLAARGYSTGSVNDRWKGYLSSIGYTGTVTDMLKEWWNYIAVALNFNLLQEDGTDLLTENADFLLLEY
jgi:hypothetical protein